MAHPPIDDADADPGAIGDGSQRAPSSSAPAEGSDAQVLAAEADELRRLVVAGSDSPEALRDLAARLREHREREDSIWRAEVKPGLVKENKGRLRGHGKPIEGVSAESTVSHAAIYGVMLLVLLVIVVVAANTTVWVLVVPVLALVGFAWKQGHEATRDRGTDPTR